jgi:hypothetical protein
VVKKQTSAIITVDDNGNVDLGTIEGLNEHKAVSLAYKAWEFCEAQGLSIDKGLSVLYYDVENPNDGAYYNAVTKNIYCPSNAAIDESTIYHEFGHFVMDIVQKDKISLADPGGSHSFSSDLIPAQAWTEGWANAFEAMVDAYHRNYDNEYGLFGWGPGVSPINIDLYNSAVIKSVSNGFHTEYAVACSIFDFWDGAFLGGNTWSDYGQDQINLSFKEIIAPFDDYAPDDFFEYFERLLARSPLNTNLKLRSEAGNILRLNEMVRHVSSYELIYDSGSTKLRWEFNDDGNGTIATGPVQRTTQNETNYVVLIPYITTYKMVYYNPGANFDIAATANMNFTDPIASGPNIKNLTYRSSTSVLRTGTTYGRANISVLNNGNVFIGGVNGANPFELIIGEQTYMNIQSGGIVTIRKGSTLRIQKNGTLRMHGGATMIIEDGAKLIVETNAYLCLSSSTNIQVLGNFSTSLQVSVYQKGVHSFTQLNPSYVCEGLEELFPYNYSGMSLQKIGNVNCVNGQFQFKVTGAFPINAQNPKICWAFPSEWTVNSNPNCESWATDAGGSVNDWGNKNYAPGEVKVLISSSLGLQSFSYYVAPVSYPVLTSLSDNPYYICQTDVKGGVKIQAAGGVGSTYNFTWTNHWGLNHTITNTANSSNLKFVSPQWSTSAQTAQIIATDANGCTSAPLAVTVYPNSNGWTSAPMYTSSQNQHSTMSETNPYAKYVSEQKGNVYYVGNDHKIYTYTYVVNAWQNYAIPQGASVANAAGPIIMKELSPGNRILYYVGTDGKIYALEATGGSATWTANSSLTINAGITSFPEWSKLALVKKGANTVLVYEKNGSLYDETNALLTNISNVGVSINGGLEIASFNNVIFYRKQGYFAKYNMDTRIETVYSTMYVDEYSDLSASNSGDVWFTQWGTMYNYNWFTNNFTGVWDAYNQSQNFSINKTSGVVYFAKLNDFYQLYYSASSNSWKTNKIGYGYPNGAIHFSNPNVFYNSGSYVHDLFYYLQGCEPSIFKTGDLEFSTGPEDYLDLGKPRINEENNDKIKITVFPQPANDGNFVVSYTLGVETKVKIELYDITGKLMQNLSSNSQTEGHHEESFNVNVADGIYLVRLNTESGLNTTKKLIIK